MLLGVDDSKTMRKVLEITFASENYRTVLATSAHDALEKLGAEPPNVVLVDAGLEGLNGYELCERIKSASPGLPVILLSSKQQPYDRNRGGQVGADDHIDNPFDTQQLIDKVNAALKKSAGAGAPAPAFATPNAPPPAPASPAEAPRPRAQTLAYGVPLSTPAPAPVASPPAYGAPAANPYNPPAPDYGAPFAGGAAYAPVPQSAPPAALSSTGPLAEKLTGLGLTPEQVSGVLALSREVIERVVWEVVPVLAETMIREEIKRLTSD